MQDGQFHFQYPTQTPEYHPSFQQPESTSLRLPSGPLKDDPELYENIDIAHQSGLTNWWNTFVSGVQDTKIGIHSADLMDDLVGKAKLESQIKQLDSEFAMGKLDQIKYLDQKNDLLDSLNKTYHSLSQDNEDIAYHQASKDEHPLSKAYQWKTNLALLQGDNSSLSDYFKYALPNIIGSSAATLGATLTSGFAGKVLKNVATRALAGSEFGVWGSIAGAVSGLATVLSINAYARNLESKAEIGSQFIQDLETLKSDYIKTKPAGYSLTNDEENELIIKASAGSNEQYWKNMSLAVSDSIQALLFAGSFTKIFKGITNTSKFTRVLGGLTELYTQGKLEALEEGLQYAFQKQKQDASKGIKDNQSFGASLLKDYVDVLGSMKFLGFGGKGPYSEDEQFNSSVYAGQVLGSLFGGVHMSFKMAKDLNSYRATTKELQALNPTKTEEPVLRFKDDLYAQFFGPKKRGVFGVFSEDSDDRVFFFKEGLKTLNKRLGQDGKPLLTDEELHRELKDINQAYSTFKKVSDNLDSILSPFGRTYTALTDLQKKAFRSELFHNTMSLQRLEPDLVKKEAEMTTSLINEGLDPEVSDLGTTQAKIDVVQKRLQTAHGNYELFLKKELGRLVNDFTNSSKAYKDLSEKEAILPRVSIDTLKAVNDYYDAAETKFDYLQKRQDLSKVKSWTGLQRWFSSYKKNLGEKGLADYEESVIQDNADFAKDADAAPADTPEQKNKKNREILERGGYGKSFIDTLTPDQMEVEANKVLEDFKNNVARQTKDQVLHAVSQLGSKDELNLLLSRPAFRTTFNELGLNESFGLDTIQAQANAMTRALIEERSEQKQRTALPGEKVAGVIVGRQKSNLDKRETIDLMKEYSVKEGKSSQRAVLQAIIDSVYATESEKELAKELLKVTKDEEIEFGDLTRKEGDKTIYEASGRYISGSNRVIIDLTVFGDEFIGNDKSQAPETVILHELIHRYTVDAITRDQELYKEIQTLIDKVKDKTSDNYNGLKNPYEFVTEAMTSPAFQKLLAATPGSNKGRSSWEAFINAVSAALKRLFNIDIRGSVLEDAISVTSGIISGTQRLNIINTSEAQTKKIDAAFDAIDASQKEAHLKLNEIYSALYTDILSEDIPELTSQALIDYLNQKLLEKEKAIDGEREARNSVLFRGREYQKGSYIVVKGYNEPFYIMGADERAMYAGKKNATNSTKLTIPDASHILFNGEKEEAEYFIEQMNKPEETQEGFTAPVLFKSIGLQVLDKDGNIAEQTDPVETHFYNFLNQISKLDLSKAPYFGLLIKDEDQYNGVNIPHSKKTVDYFASGGKRAQVVVIVDSTGTPVLFDQDGKPSSNGTPVVFNIETPETILKRDSKKLADALGLSIKQAEDIKYEAAKKVRQIRDSAANGNPVLLRLKSVSSGIAFKDAIDEIKVREMTEVEAKSVVDGIKYLQQHPNQELKDFLFNYIIGKGDYKITGGKILNKGVEVKDPTAEEIVTNFSLKKVYALAQENKPFSIIRVGTVLPLPYILTTFPSYQQYLKSVSNLKTDLTQSSYNRYLVYDIGNTLKKEEKEGKVEQLPPKQSFEGGNLFDSPLSREQAYKRLYTNKGEMTGAMKLAYENMPEVYDEETLRDAIKNALENLHEAARVYGADTVQALYDAATYEEVKQILDNRKKQGMTQGLVYLEDLLLTKTPTSFDSPASTNDLGLFNNLTTYNLVKTIDKGVHSYLRMTDVKTVGEATEDPDFISRVLEVTQKNILAKLDQLRALREKQFEDKEISGLVYQVELAKINDKIEKIYKEWPKIVNYYLRNSYVFSYSKEIKYGYDEQGNPIREGDDTHAGKGGGFDRVGNEVSPIDGASKEVKALVRGLSKFKELNGKLVRSLNEFNVPDLGNFPVMWNNLLKNLNNIEDFTEMLTKMESIKEPFPEYEELLDIMRKYYIKAQNGDVEARRMIALFKRDLGKPEVPIIENIISVSGDSTSFKIDEATRKNVRELKKIFLDNFLSNSTYKATTTSGNIGLSKRILEASTATKADRIRFFEGLGFKFSSGTLNDPSFDVLASASVIGLFKNDIRKLQDSKFIIKDPLSDLSKRTKLTQGLAKRINDLLELESRYSRVAPSLSMQNVEDNTEWGISNPNGYTIVFAAINDAEKYPTFQDLIAEPEFSYLGKPYALSSHILNQVFNLDSEVDFGKRRDKENPVRVELINISGLKIEDAAGQKTTSLYIGDKIASDFNQFLKSGSKETTRAGDKNSAFGIKVTGYYQNNKRLRLPISDFALFSGAQGYGGELMLNIMEKYLTSELARIWLGEQGYLSNINKLGNLVKEFSLFRDILSTETQDELKAKLDKIDRKDMDGDPANAYEFVAPIAASVMSSPKVVTDIKNFFYQEAAKKLQSLNRYGFNFQNNYWLDDSLKAFAKDTLLRAYIVNEFIVHVEQTKLVNGDVVFYSHKNGEYHKRTPKDGATGIIPITDAWWVDAANKDPNNNLQSKLLGVNNEYSNALKTIVFRELVAPSAYVKEWSKYLKSIGLSKDQVSRIVDPYKANKEADAQGWITMDFYRNFKMSIGDWRSDQEKVYDKVSKGEFLSVEEVETLHRLFPPIKAQYAGPVQHEYYHVPGFHKFSLMPLIPSAIKGTALEHLNERMLRNNVSYALMESGSKVGTIAGKALEPFYKDKARNMEDPTKAFDNENIIYMQFLKEQVQIEPELHDEVIYGTQFRKLLFQNVYSNSKPLVERFAKLEQEYDDIINEITEFEKSKLTKQLGVEPDFSGGKLNSYKIVDETKLIQKLQEEIANRRLNDNIKQFFELKDGKLKFTIDASQNHQQIRNMIMSMINNRLVRQTIKGDMLIQGASTGYERYSKPTEQDELQYGTNGLRFYHVKEGKTLAMQVKVPLTGDFKNLLKYTWNGEKIKTLDRLNQALKDQKWVKENRKSITMIGYRIPTQGLNSIEMMEVVEFLPSEAGNILIVPTEIVTKAGSDFDIDKLNVFKPSIKENKKDDTAEYLPKPRKKIDFNKFEKLDQLDKVQGQIKEIQDSIDYIETKLKENVDADTYNTLVGLKSDLSELVIEKAIVLDEIEEINTYKGGLFNRIIELGAERLSDPASFVDLLTPNSTDLIKPIVEEELGVKAKSYKHTNNLVSSTQEEKYLAGIPNKSALGIAAVANTFSQLLSKVGTQLNNTFNAKPVYHPMIDHPYNLSNQTLKGGLSKSEIASQMINAYVDVLNDDFIAKANLSIDTAGSFFYLLHLGHDPEQLIYFYNNPIIKAFVAEIQKSRSLLIKNLDPNYDIKSAKRNAFTAVVDPTEQRSLKSLRTIGEKLITEKYFSKDRLKEVLNKPITSFSKEEKLAVLSYYLQVLDQTNQLFTLQQINNYDTSTSVNPISHEFREFLKKGLVAEGLFTGNVEDITNKTVIKPFNQYKLISSVLDTLLPISLGSQIRKEIVNMIAELSENFNLETDPEKLTRIFVNDWLYYLYVNNGELKDGRNVGDYGRSLLFGETRLSNALLELKIQDKWKRLRDEFPIINQLRIEQDNDIFNISLYRDDNSTEYQNTLIEQFSTLGNFDDPTYSPEDQFEIKKFFRNLAILGFTQSGLNKSPISFTDIIPNDFYVPLMHEALQKYEGLDPELKTLQFNEFVSMFRNQNPHLFGESRNVIAYWRFKSYKSNLGATAKDHAMSYKMPANENIWGVDTSTLAEAESGRRTATTRSYPLGKVGDIITFEGRPQRYEITELEQLSGEFATDSEWLQKWSEKEGWTVEHFKKVFGGSTVHLGSWQTSFKKVETFDSPINSQISSVGSEEEYNQYLSETLPSNNVGVLYHGTHNSFNKFSSEHVGSGEGGKVYGVGIYLSEQKEVGNTYANYVSGKRNSLLGRIFRKKGNMYTVVILKDNPDFIAWDKPISAEQAQKIKAALGNIANESKNTNLVNTIENKGKGRLVYRALTTITGSGKAASDLLANAGIDGVKYPTDDIHEKREEFKDSSNYVVFDPNQIRILGSKDDIEGFKSWKNKTFNSPILSNQLNSVSLEEGTYQALLKNLLEAGLITPKCDA